MNVNKYKSIVFLYSVEYTILGKYQVVFFFFFNPDLTEYKYIKR